MSRTRRAPRRNNKLQVVRIQTRRTTEFGSKKTRSIRPFVAGRRQLGLEKGRERLDGRRQYTKKYWTGGTPETDKILAELNTAIHTKGKEIKHRDELRQKFSKENKDIDMEIDRLELEIHAHRRTFTRNGGRIEELRIKIEHYQKILNIGNKFPTPSQKNNYNSEYKEYFSLCEDKKQMNIKIDIVNKKKDAKKKLRDELFMSIFNINSQEHIIKTIEKDHPNIVKLAVASVELENKRAQREAEKKKIEDAKKQAEELAQIEKEIKAVVAASAKETEALQKDAEALQKETDALEKKKKDKKNVINVYNTGAPSDIEFTLRSDLLRHAYHNQNNTKKERAKLDVDLAKLEPESSHDSIKNKIDRLFESTDTEYMLAQYDALINSEILDVNLLIRGTNVIINERNWIKIITEPITKAQEIEHKRRLKDAEAARAIYADLRKNLYIRQGLPRRLLKEALNQIHRPGWGDWATSIRRMHFIRYVKDLYMQIYVNHETLVHTTISYIQTATFLLSVGVAFPTAVAIGMKTIGVATNVIIGTAFPALKGTRNFVMAGIWGASGLSAWELAKGTVDVSVGALTGIGKGTMSLFHR